MEPINPIEPQHEEAEKAIEKEGQEKGEEEEESARKKAGRPYGMNHCAYEGCKATTNAQYCHNHNDSRKKRNEKIKHMQSQVDSAKVLLEWKILIDNRVAEIEIKMAKALEKLEELMKLPRGCRRTLKRKCKRG